MATIPAGVNYLIRHTTVDPIEQYGKIILSPEDNARALNHFRYQTQKLRGFSIAQLKESGCFGKDDTKPSNLVDEEGVVIHPIYELKHWPQGDEECEEIGFGFEGRWDVNGNEKVRSVVLPCLGLATAMLVASTSWSWFDALYNGRREQLDPRTLPDGCPHSNPYYSTTSFHVRSPLEVASARDDLKRHLEFLRGKLRICIKSAVARAQKSVRKSLTLGLSLKHIDMTESGLVYRGSEITIASEAVLPLLMEDLTTSERLAQQFAVAKTLVHETMHAAGVHARLLIETKPQRIAPEPFFEDEEITELGRSWEAATFSGYLNHLHAKSPSNFHQPVLGLTIDLWPNWTDFSGRFVHQGPGTRYRHHIRFGAGAKYEYWPIHTGYLEDIQQVSYWSTFVSKYGTEALQPPRIIGLRYIKNNPPAPPAVEALLGPAYAELTNSNGTVLPPKPITDDDEELARWHEHQRQRVRADVINMAMSKQHKLILPQLAQLRQAVQSNDLSQLRGIWTKANNLCDQGNEMAAFDICSILMTSQWREIRARSAFTCAKLKMACGKADRLQFCSAALGDLQALLVEDLAHQGFWQSMIDEVQRRMLVIEAEAG